MDFQLVMEMAGEIWGRLFVLTLLVGLTWMGFDRLAKLDRRWTEKAQSPARSGKRWTGRGVAFWEPCWEKINCPPRFRNPCPVFARFDVVCWDFFRRNGRLNPACLTCKMLPKTLIQQIEQTLHTGGSYVT